MFSQSIDAEPILGIDYGLKNVGLAISQAGLPEPLKQLRYSEKKEAFNKIKKTCQQYQVKTVVLGMPHGSLKQAATDFGRGLQNYLDCPVIFWDETLTSQESIKKTQHLGYKKRQKTRHAVAAALILQDYLERKPGN